MGTKELRLQRELIAAALDVATDDQLRAALDGTIGDTQAFSWDQIKLERSAPERWSLLGSEAEAD